MYIIRRAAATVRVSEKLKKKKTISITMADRKRAARHNGPRV